MSSFVLPSTWHLDMVLDLAMIVAYRFDGMKRALEEYIPSIDKDVPIPTFRCLAVDSIRVPEGFTLPEFAIVKVCRQKKGGGKVIRFEGGNHLVEFFKVHVEWLESGQKSWMDIYTFVE